jgi:hypothetical protein
VADALVLADFNERDREGNVLALPEDVSARRLEVGSRVTVRDSEGNEAKADVVSVDKRLVRLRVDWMSWRDADERPIFVIRDLAIVDFQENRGTVELYLVPGEVTDLMTELREAVKASTQNRARVTK